MRLAAAVVLLALSWAAGCLAAPIASTPSYNYRVVNTYPHDPAAFTEGLAFDSGWLYEGTGVKRASSIRKVELATGTVVQQYRLANSYFGEGISILGDNLYQLTWQSQVGFVYDKATFRLLRKFPYSGEGWGLTNDGKRLIMSNGTSTLAIIDPLKLKKIGSIKVRDNGRPVTRLNELEYVDGEIFANVWQTDWIVRILPQTGNVTGWINLQGILGDAEQYPNADVLNGIAYDPANHRLFVTGKYWPKLFEIELIPLAQSAALPPVVLPERHRSPELP